MIRLPLLPHKDEILVGTIIVLSFMLWKAGLALEAAKVKPEVEEHHYTVDARTEDVRRGSVKIKRKTVVAPDGTKTTESERTIGPVESHVAVTTEAVVDRKETPIFAPARAPRTRYLGLGVDPLNYARFPRLRAGVTILGALDLGVAYDSRFSPAGGAFGLEVACRF